MSKPYNKKEDYGLDSKKYSTKRRKNNVKQIPEKKSSSIEDKCSVNVELKTENENGDQLQNLMTKIKAEIQDNPSLVSLFDNIVNKKEMSKEMKMQFIPTILPYFASSPAKDFFNLVQTEILESARRNNLIFLSALFKALEDSKKLTRSKSSSLKDFKMPETYFDFTMCEDEQFQEMVHVTRKTAKILIDHIRGIPIDMDNNSEQKAISHNNEPIDKMLFLLLWYLRNEDKKLEDAVSMFELGTVENANRLLNRGVFYILKLKADSGLLWPTAEEFSYTAKCIDSRFSFPNVAAVMGHRIIKCKNGQRFMLQTICNEKYMFIDAGTSFNTRPRVLNESMLSNKIRDLSDGLVIISEDFSVPNKYKKKIIVPYKDGPAMTSSEKQLYNLMHDFVIGILTNAFNHLLTRFPKLKLLDRCEPDLVTAACVLHNYCIKLNDLTPL